MLTVKTFSDRSEIEQHLDQCMHLAHESGCTLPAQYLYVPLLWWDTFNNVDGTDFNQKRSTNFLGARSRLIDLRLFVVMDGKAMAGAMPIVSYLVKVGSGDKQLRVFTFPGDYQLLSRQDFTVVGTVRREAIKTLLDCLIQCMEDDDDIILIPYVPEDSPNIRELQSYLSEASTRGFSCLSAMTGRRGGVRPWTLNAILSCLRQVRDRVTARPLKDGVTMLITDLAACPPIKMLFPKNRKGFEEKIRALMGSLEADPVLSPITNVLEELLTDAPIIYPYIQLPKDHKTYMNDLGKSTRTNTRNIKNRFAKNGGDIEKVNSAQVTEQDIGDYLRLHDLRWGGGSASLKGDASLYFHNELCRKLVSHGLLNLFFARFRGKRIAGCSCIDIQGRREIYLTGRDPEYDGWGAGRLVLLESILDAIGGGLNTYDMGLGWFAYKMAFAKRSMKTWNFFLSPRKGSKDFEGMYLGYECLITS